jgi:hypothetical protein
MNAAEYKQLEGQRIQQVLSAIGALPAAMLVFGDGPSASAAGAPLFAMAIALIVGALMHWNYTDAAYHMDCTEHSVAPEEQHRVNAWQKDLEAAGYRFQRRTYFYGIASLLCSIAGVAAVYSTIRFGVSVEAGFWAVGVGAVAICAEVVVAGNQRNALLDRCRKLS